MSEHPSAVFARELIAALAHHGVQDYVLCPGSRSGPLAHALAEAASSDAPMGAPRVNLHVRIDERSAAFVALGIARARHIADTPSPVAVITTSGTAVGNLMPAVMEAHHAGVPLLLLTADRPGELRGVGANQTTDQVGLFGTFVRWSADVAAPTDGERPGRATRVAEQAVAVAMGQPRFSDDCGKAGPVHVDLEFREPLGPDGGVWPKIGGGESAATKDIHVQCDPTDDDKPLPPVERCIVIAGDGAGPKARQIAQAHQWPLFAEPTSGARSGDQAIPGYLAAMTSKRGQQLLQQVHQIVVVGRPTLSRPISALVKSAPALYVAAHGARWREAPRHADRIMRDVPDSWLTSADPDQPAQRTQWLADWQRLAPKSAYRPERWGADMVAHLFVQSLGPGDVALLGSSGPIRTVDRLAPIWKTGKEPTVVANRGLAGIDGTVSTAFGLALGSSRPVVALMGDVTFLHDIGGLLVGPREDVPDVRIVVVNDGGGTIFAGLEHAAAPQERVERVFTTPHGADLASLCAGYGVAHIAVDSVVAMKEALAVPVSGISVVEATVAWARTPH